MGHPQPATPIKTNNSTASGISNNTMKQQRSCAMDMRFYWIHDRVQQGQFLIYWQPGTQNLADYFTKHHAPQHHCEQRYVYLHKPPQINHALCTTFSLLQGCIKYHTAQTAVQTAHTVTSTKNQQQPHSMSCTNQYTKNMQQTSTSYRPLIY